MKQTVLANKGINKYLLKFDQAVIDQLIDSQIFSGPDNIINNIEDLEDLSSYSKKDQENFLKILKFKAPKGEEPAEFAISWIMNGEPVGKNHGKADVLLKNGDTISVKHVVSRRRMKFGRVGSSEAYKTLMSFWSFYVHFLSDPKLKLNPTKITRDKLNNTELKIPKNILKFLFNSSNNLDPFTKEERCDILSFINKFEPYKDSIQVSAKDLINKMMKESLGDEVDHLVIVMDNSIKVKVIKNINKSLDFYDSYFSCLSGNEIYINIRGD